MSWVHQFMCVYRVKVVVYHLVEMKVHVLPNEILQVAPRDRAKEPNRCLHNSTCKLQILNFLNFQPYISKNFSAMVSYKLRLNILFLNLQCTLYIQLAVAVYPCT